MTALLVTLLLSLIFFLGVCLAALEETEEKIESVSVALAFGAMAAVAAFDIIPEVVEGIGENGVSVWAVVAATALGFFILLALDRFVPEHEGSEKTREGNLVHIGIMTTLAIAIHNIVEGMSVYSISSSSFSSGFLLALGVALHNIPMGILISSTTRSEEGWKRAVIITVSSLSTFIGGLLMMFLEPYLSPLVVELLTSLALGMVLYILLMELLPDVIHSERKLWSLLWIMVGLVIVILGGLFE